MRTACVFSPAKVNLTLTVTGRRPDGFHELTSLVTPIAFGDMLWIEELPGATADVLECAYPGVPTDPSNLVLKAASAFRKRHAAAVYFRFRLEKMVPPGAGLGGGSGNAAAALRLMNHWLGEPLSLDVLAACAAECGSDCPLFLYGRPVIMRGRGEKVEVLSEKEAGALSGNPVILMKPDFPVATAWAYGRMREHGGWYIPQDQAEAELAAWRKAPTWESLPLVNNIEKPVFEKYLALPALLSLLREKFGIRCMMSGSGSTCFALPNRDTDAKAVEAAVREAWGPSALIIRTAIL